MASRSSGQTVVALLALVPLVAILMAQAGATGPTVVWLHDGVNVDHFEVCVDAAACIDVGASPNKDTNGAGTFGWKLAAPLAGQSHRFVVRACNALACVDSDPFVLGPPGKPTIKAVK